MLASCARHVLCVGKDLVYLGCHSVLHSFIPCVCHMHYWPTSLCDNSRHMRLQCHVTVSEPTCIYCYSFIATERQKTLFLLKKHLDNISFFNCTKDALFTCLTAYKDTTCTNWITLREGKKFIKWRSCLLLSTKDYEDSCLTVLFCYLPDLCLGVCNVHYQINIIPLYIVLRNGPLLWIWLAIRLSL